MPKDFIVVRVDFKEDWNSPQYGPFKCYEMELEEAPQGSGIGHRVEMNQKPTTAPPTAGEEVYGDITPNKNADFPAKFKKASKDGDFSGGGGGGSKGGSTFKPRDPSEIAGARHAHNLLVAAHSFPPMVPEADGRTMASKQIQARLDDLEAFACVLDEKTAAISDAAKGFRKVKPSGASTTKTSGTDDVPF